MKTKNDKFDTLFKTKIPKNIPWLAARPHYALIREYPPPRAEWQDLDLIKGDEQGNKKRKFAGLISLEC